MKAAGLGDRVRGPAPSRTGAAQTGLAAWSHPSCANVELRCWIHELPHGRPLALRHPGRRARRPEDASGVARVTAMEGSRHLSQLVGAPVHLKCARTFSGPARSSCAAPTCGPPDCCRRERAGVVVTASAGNHAQEWRWPPRCSACTPPCSCPRAHPCPRSARPGTTAPRCACTARWSTRALAAAQEYAAETGAVFIHPFDHPDVIAGQGTVGLEILEQCSEVRTVVVGMGGGGARGRYRGGGQGAAAGRPDRRRAGGGRRLRTRPRWPPGARCRWRIRRRWPTASRWGGRASCRSAWSASWWTRSARSARTSCRRRCCSAWSGPSWSWSRPGPARSPRYWPRRTPSRARSSRCSPAATSTRCFMQRVLRHGMAAQGRYLAVRLRLTDRPGALATLLGVLSAVDANVLDVSHVRTDPRLGLYRGRGGAAPGDEGPGALCRGRPGPCVTPATPSWTDPPRTANHPFG